MRTNPSCLKSCGGNCPVEQVSWHDALRFANKLSRKASRETCYRCNRQKCQLKTKFSSDYSKYKGWYLPSEAEWEYVARAGTYVGNLIIKGSRNAPILDKRVSTYH